MEMKFYWRGIFKFISVWSERVWVMSVRKEAKKWNIRWEWNVRGNHMREWSAIVECEREECEGWGVRECVECKSGVGCECGV